MGWRWRGSRDGTIAILSTLSIGIEPTVLMLLVTRDAVPAWSVGLVSGAGQLGMGIGALACARYARLARPPIVAAAGWTGAAATIGLAYAVGLPAVLLLRLMLGAAMGLCFAEATAAAARDHPHRAIGAIVLGQQLLATVSMAALTLVAAYADPAIALAGLVAGPAAIALLSRRGPAGAGGAEAAEPGPGPSRHDPFATVVMGLTMALTMMIWSYLSTLGVALDLNEDVVGNAIAGASLASVPAALLALVMRPVARPWLVGALCGGAMLSPLLLPASAGLTSYVAAMALFNGGAAVSSIRFSGWAMERADAAARRGIATVQLLAMSAGPVLGAVAVRCGGLRLLAEASLVGVAAILTVALVAQQARIADPGPLPATT